MSQPDLIQIAKDLGKLVIIQVPEQPAPRPAKSDN
jgi:hypothetical protein